MPKHKKLVFIIILTVFFNILQITSLGAETYTVKSGDTLWKISNASGVAINDLKLINGLETDSIIIGQVLKLGPDSHLYTVKSGDTLWIISNKFGVTIAGLKALNGLTGDSIYAGQSLKIMPDTVTYKVKSADTLYKIASKFGTTVSDIVSVNKLKSDVIYVSQTLLVPYKSQGNSMKARPAPVLSWPSITYTVRDGDNVTVISRKFGVPASDIMKYNYMTDSDWFNAGEKIAINGYAPRNYAVYPGMDPAPTKYGHLTDWFLDGKYILKRNAVLTVTDLQTGKAFKVSVLGGYNHADVEPVSAGDTNVMKQLWPSWNWTPRPVVIFKDGMNIAASLSGMPHSYDTTPGNGVTGHFDCYLLNSTPHDLNTSNAYVSQHSANVYKAAGVQK